MSEDICNQWIARVAGGKSFLEVGGLWGEISERAAPAHEVGATDSCMVDV